MFFKESVREFLAAADAGSFSEAARRLYMTQSALSQKMRAFERGLGIELFVRSKQGVSLTPAGQSLYEDLARLAPLCSAAYEKALRFATSDAESTRIGVISTRESICYRGAVARVREAHPLAHIRYVPSPYEQSLRESCLLEGRYDLVRCELHASIGQAGLAHTELGDDENCLLMAVDHPLACCSALTVEDLAGEVIAVLPNDPDSTAELVRVAIMQRAPGATVIRVPLDAATMLRVQFGECCLLATRSTGALEDGGTVSIPLVGVPPAHMVLMHRRETTPVQQALIQEICADWGAFGSEGGAVR